MKKAKPAKDIDDYIAKFPDDVQAILSKVRSGRCCDARFGSRDRQGCWLLSGSASRHKGYPPKTCSHGITHG